ncbi:MAG TPA: response regulator transcription factor [Steroidobacteraceae bacterium]|jgi:FixJ family two-component response regulator
MKDLTPTVFIVDDDSGVRSSIRVLMKSVGLAATVFASAKEFLEGYHAIQPGCLVLDIRMPGMSGLELQEELNKRGAVIPVIFVTGHADVPMAVEAMRHGAFDFLQKPLRDQDLVDRVQKALAHDRDTREALKEHGRIRARIASLTPREKEVLDLLTVGKANKMMAQDLGLSQRTVEIHRAHVMEKMGAKSIAQLVRMVMDLEQHGRSTTKE